MWWIAKWYLNHLRNLYNLSSQVLAIQPSMELLQWCSSEPEQTKEEKSNQIGFKISGKLAGNYNIVWKRIKQLTWKSFLQTVRWLMTWWHDRASQRLFRELNSWPFLAPTSDSLRNGGTAEKAGLQDWEGPSTLSLQSVHEKAGRHGCLLLYLKKKNERSACFNYLRVVVFGLRQIWYSLMKSWY